MPVTHQGFAQQTWERLFNTTLAETREGLQESMMRKYMLGALLESNGRVTYNHGGNGFQWEVQYRLPPASSNTGEQTRNFVRRNYWKVANLDWRGYEVTDSMTKFEFYANRTEEGLVKIMDRMEGNLKRGLSQHFGRQYYVDGYATGNELCWCGFDSMFGHTSNTTIDITAAAATRTANQADVLCSVSDTYAGISTALGTYGGSQETSVPWPHGTASLEYDFWSPLKIIFDSSEFGATNDKFDKGHQAIRYGLIHTGRNTSSLDTQITNVFLDRELFRVFKNNEDAKESIQVDAASQGALRKLGFLDTFVFDGREISSENGVPDRVGYGFSINNIELASMAGTLLETESEWDMRTQSYNAVVSTLSQLVFGGPNRDGPRSIFKLVEFDSAQV